MGTPEVRVDGDPAAAEVMWRKNLALLVYLCLSPGRARAREHLMTLLWTDSAQDRARRSLNEAVRQLRRHLGAGRVIGEGRNLRISDERLWLDVDALEDARAEDLESLVRGRFLEGFGVPDSNQYEDWLTASRSHYGSLAVSALAEEAQANITAGRLDRALSLTRRGLLVDPLSETHIRLAMQATALGGNTRGALALYREHLGRLEREVAGEPGPELERLKEALGSRTWRRSAASRVAVELPLVGREGVHRSCFSDIERVAAGSSRYVALQGASGSGKTRLLGECLKRAVLSGFAVAEATPLASDTDRPWSTLRLLFRGGLGDLPGIAGAHPRSLALIKGVAPGLPLEVEPVHAEDVSEMSGAVVDLVAAATEEGPVMLVLDDAHLADDNTATALSAVRSAGVQRFCLLFAAERVDEHDQLAALIDPAIDSRSKLHTLEPLVEEDVRELAVEPLSLAEESDEARRVAVRLTRESGGNPLLLTLLVRALMRGRAGRSSVPSWPPASETVEAPLPVDLPSAAAAAVLTHVRGLSESAHATLPALVVLGGNVDLETLAAVSGRDTEVIVAGLSELEREGLVVYEGGFGLSARILRTVLRDTYLTPGERARLARRAVDVLCSAEDLESQVRGFELAGELDVGHAPDMGERLLTRAADSGAVHLARRIKTAMSLQGR